MKKQTFENISGPLCPTRRLFSRLGLFIVRPSCRVRPVVADVILRPSVRPRRPFHAGRLCITRLLL